MVNSKSLTVRSLHSTDVALKKEPGATFIPQNAKNHCAVKRGPRYRSKLRLNQDSELVLQRDSAFWEMHLGKQG